MKRIFDWFARAWAERRTREELYALSDHMLRDIGLRREEIQRTVLRSSTTRPAKA